MEQQQYKTCPVCSEKIKAEAIKCRYCLSLLENKPIPRLTRSRNGRAIAGVCQGLSNYFGVPVTVLRLLFIVATFVGGWGIFIYLCLCLLPATSKSSADKESADHPRPSRIIKFINFVIFIVFLVCVYIPLGLFLLGSLFFCLWSFIYPVVHIDIFRFSLTDLGAPGVVFGIFECLILCHLILILTHVVARLHFLRSVVKGGVVWHMILLMFFVTGIGSSLAVVFFEYSSLATRTWSKNISIAPDQKSFKITRPQSSWLGIPLRGIRIKTSREEQNIKIICTVEARGMVTKEFLNFFEPWSITWTEESPVFPEVKSAASGFHFAAMTLDLTIPDETALELDLTPPGPIEITGTLSSLVLKSQDGIFLVSDASVSNLKAEVIGGSLTLNQSQCPDTNIKIENGRINGYLVKFDNFTIQNRYGWVCLNKSKANHWNINNQRGDIILKGCEGALDIKDEDGCIEVRSQNFPDSTINRISTENGCLNISLGNFRPILDIKKYRGRFSGIAGYEASGTATLTLSPGDGELVLDIDCDEYSK